MSYTQVFGGTTIYPSDVSYLALSLDADTELEWPLESSGNLDPVARIIDVTPSGAYSIIMPAADLTSPGQTVLFNNLGPDTITVKSNTGSTLASIAAGAQWQLYLVDNSTATGAWRTFRYGAATAQAQASALAGYGLVAIGSTLAQESDIVSYSTDYTIGDPDRAKTFLWTGGLGVFNLPDAATVGNGWFINVRNGGDGDVTLTPAGSDPINGGVTLTLQPEDSAVVVSDGIGWYTIGLGQQAVFAFDYTSINLTGVSGTYTLSGSELNRIAYTFTGLVAGDIEVVIPSTVQQYWINNETIGGSYTLTFKTVTQTPGVAVPRNERGIYYCDGNEIVKAVTTSGVSTPISIADGGTGATSAAGARSNLGATSVGSALFTASSQSAGRTAILAAASGVNSDITEITGLTTPLSIAQGGTSATTASAARTALGATTVGSNVFTAVDQAAARSAITAQETLVSGTNLKTVNGVSLLGSGDVPIIPSGTKMLFVQTSAPTGWTKDTTHNDKALRVVSGTAGTGGSVAFTTAFASQAVSGTVGGTALTEAQLPSHFHAVFADLSDTDTVLSSSNFPNYRRDTGGNFSYEVTAANATTPTLGRTAPVGSGSTHTHSFTGTAINLAVQYVDVIVATKD